MYDLTNTQILTFEIGNECNLKPLHLKCPINSRIEKEVSGAITVLDIIQVIREAQELNFKGMVGFHYYNEPLLYKDKILYIMEQAPDVKYLLWTNGTLLKDGIAENAFLESFESVVITCYFNDMLEKFTKLKEHYKNIHIELHELDDRKEIYQNKSTNTFGCQRPSWEIPIDYWGNLHLCCMDWNGTYTLGNIKVDSFKNIIGSHSYQNAVKTVYKKKLDLEWCPEVCKHCRSPFLVPDYMNRYKKLLDKLVKKEDIV